MLVLDDERRCLAANRSALDLLGAVEPPPALAAVVASQWAELAAGDGVALRPRAAGSSAGARRARADPRDRAAAPPADAARGRDSGRHPDGPRGAPAPSARRGADGRRLRALGVGPRRRQRRVERRAPPDLRHRTAHDRQLRGRPRLHPPRRPRRGRRQHQPRARQPRPLLAGVPGRPPGRHDPSDRVARRGRPCRRRRAGADVRNRSGRHRPPPRRVRPPQLLDDPRRLRRCDQRLLARRHPDQLEPRCGEALRLYGRGGDRPPGGDAAAAGRAQREPPQMAALPERRARRALRVRADHEATDAASSSPSRCRRSPTPTGRSSASPRSAAT